MTEPTIDPADIERLTARYIAEEPDLSAASARNRAESDLISEAKWRAARWEKQIPRRFRDAHEGQLVDPLATAVAKWRKDWTRNLVLLGDVGTGKTHAAVAALRIVNEAGHRFTFWPTAELLDSLRPDGSLDDVEEVSFLLLDDLGAERMTEWAAERIYTLVNRRWLDGLPTIATSNLAVSNGKGPLVDALGERTYSRLVHGAVVVQVAGADRRRTA